MTVRSLLHSRRTSRRHCSVSRSSGGQTDTDCGSAGARAAPHWARCGDRQRHHYPASPLRRLGVCDGAGYDDATDPDDLHRRIDGAAALPRSLLHLRTDPDASVAELIPSLRLRAIGDARPHPISAQPGKVGDRRRRRSGTSAADGGMPAYATPPAWRAVAITPQATSAYRQPR